MYMIDNGVRLRDLIRVKDFNAPREYYEMLNNAVSL